MRFKFYLPVAALIIFSCNEKKAALSPEKMEAVLIDLHYAEAYSMLTHPANDSTKEKSQRNVDSLALFYTTVFKHHNITREEFGQSLNWYKANPAQLDSVYAKMIPELATQEEIYTDAN